METDIHLYIHTIDSLHAWILISNNSIHHAIHERINTYGEIVTPTILFQMPSYYIYVAIRQGGFYFNDKYVKLQEEKFSKDYFCEWDNCKYKLIYM